MTDVKTHVITESELAHKLADFERRYSVPSDRMVEAFMHDGRIVETDDLHDWQAIYAAWRICQRHREPTPRRAS